MRGGVPPLWVGQVRLHVEKLGPSVVLPVRKHSKTQLGFFLTWSFSLSLFPKDDGNAAVHGEFFVQHQF